MSSKNKTPRKPENKLVNRQDVINFSNFLATNPDFCLRVLHTAQQAVAAENAKAELVRRAVEGEATYAGPDYDLSPEQAEALLP